MSNPKARGEETDSKEESTGQDLTDDTVELRLPPKTQYLPVLRAATGVVAGTLSFNYDEILQLRVAVSEAFGLAIRHLKESQESTAITTLSVHFIVGSNELEILVTDPGTGPSPVEGAEDGESRAVLECLLDRVEFGVEAAGARVIRMVKRNSGERV
jgi:anti-sigma regulatory factor (Ser/Thr protein kinase)